MIEDKVFSMASRGVTAGIGQPFEPMVAIEAYKAASMSHDSLLKSAARYALVDHLLDHSKDAGGWLVTRDGEVLGVFTEERVAQSVFERYSNASMAKIKFNSDLGAMDH